MDRSPKNTLYPFLIGLGTSGNLRRDRGPSLPKGFEPVQKKDAAVASEGVLFYSFDVRLFLTSSLTLLF